MLPALRAKLSTELTGLVGGCPANILALSTRPGTTRSTLMDPTPSRHVVEWLLTNWSSGFSRTRTRISTRSTLMGPTPSNLCRFIRPCETPLPYRAHKPYHMDATGLSAGPSPAFLLPTSLVHPDHILLHPPPRQRDLMINASGISSASRQLSIGLLFTVFAFINKLCKYPWTSVPSCRHHRDSTTEQDKEDEHSINKDAPSLSLHFAWEKTRGWSSLIFSKVQRSRCLRRRPRQAG